MGKKHFIRREWVEKNFYIAKSMMKPLGLGYQKIDMCLNFHILYYNENTDLIECKTCGHARYKLRTGRGRTLVAHKKLRYFSITSRLQRLFMSPKTDDHMTRHHSYNVMDRVMVKLFDIEVWKQFNRMCP
jgi:hypothetical protein